MQQGHLCFSILCALVTTLPARAAGGDLLDLSLDDLIKIEVRVASRNAEPAWLAPASVSVFTYSEIRRLGLRNLTDLLNQVPGVQALFEPTEGRDNFLQGRGNPESYGQSFLLLLDGQRLNEHYTGGFTLANRFVTLGNVDRVEVIRGPGSALYGGNAFSGVINIVTSNEREDVEVAIGSHQGRRASANLSGTAGDWQLSAFVQANGDEGERYTDIFDRFRLQTETRDPRENYDAYVTAKRGEAFIRGRYSRHRLNDFYTFRRVSDGINEDVNSQAFAELGYRWQASEKLIGTWSVSYSQTQWQTFARLALQAPGEFAAADWLQGVRLDYRHWQGAGDFVYTLSPEHRINFGLLAEKADIPVASQNSNYDPVDGRYLGGVVELRDDLYRFVGDRARTVLGLYVQDQYRFNDRWHVTGGLRYDRYNDVGGSLSPRLSVVYSPGPDDTWKLLYGEGFRAPGLGDLYDREAGQTLGNPNLSPITNQTLELAYKHKGSGWQAGATLFHTRSQGLLSAVVLPDGRPRVENVGSNRNHGFELEAAAELGAHWQLKANYTRILSNETRGIPDPSVLLAEDLAAKAFGSFSLNYRHGNWNHNLNGLWRAELPILPNDSSYHPINLVTTWSASASLQWQLGLYNLTDEQGAAVARGGGLGRLDGQIVRAIPMRGREVWLSVNYAF